LAAFDKLKHTKLGGSIENRKEAAEVNRGVNEKSVTFHSSGGNETF
jgi:hypothetical protein